jgi:hypothetical protein
MTTQERNGVIPALGFCVLAAISMAYGWGYRGTVGHEAGAMLPGALLGLVLCLGSGRLDWHRRAAVVGLFAAVGWAWGGSISYMEQTFYVMSDSLPDVLYGYTMLFFIGGLWAGCGGAILGLGLTESRTELERLIRPFMAVCTVFVVAYVYFLFVPEHREAYETFTVIHFHDGDWLSATLTLVVSAVYWLVRPQDRRATILFLGAAISWWIGYGLLTKLGGLRLAPLHRSESWGGVLGILVFLIVILIRRENRAALMLCLYGCIGGGLAFALAVFIHHPIALQWGPFEHVHVRLPAWRMAEVSFGFFMGLAIALGALRLLRGGLAPPEEDSDRAASDVFAVFMMIVALTWINFRRHFARVLQQSGPPEDTAFLGLEAGSWYVLIGVIMTVPVLYALYWYRRGDRALVPQSAFGKGTVVTLLLVWMTVAAQLLDGYPSRNSIIANLCLWLPAAVASCLLISFMRRANQAVVPGDADVSPSDPRWRVGPRYVLLCALAPVFLASITGLSMAMQDGSAGARGRLRFGPNAYWRQTARLQGTWKAVHLSRDLKSTEIHTGDLPLAQLEFDAYRNVVATLPSGERVEAHRWFLKNQYIWLQWFGKAGEHYERAEVPLQFRDQRLYIAWPPHKGNEGHLVFERITDQ